MSHQDFSHHHPAESSHILLISERSLSAMYLHAERSTQDAAFSQRQAFFFHFLLQEGGGQVVSPDADVHCSN